MKHLLFTPLAAAFSGALATALCLAAAPALAQNKGGGSTGSSSGVITIDQAKAEVGGITPGDTPGFPITLSRCTGVP